MKKIIMAVDGTNFSEGAFEFVRQLNEKASLLLTGVFVPQMDYANLWSYAAASSGGAAFIPLVEEEESDEVIAHIQKFESLCQKHGITYRVHKDFYDFALPELKRESRFADVMILSGELFYRQIIGANQMEYMRHVLHNSECPVLLVPEKFQFPDNNTLAYDGSEESVFAIKQFAYIFPELASNPTLLVYADEDSEKELPSKDLIIELATQHYPLLTLEKSEINPKKYFAAWVEDKKSSILVSGSFSRSVFSETIRKSFVVDVIRDHQLPLFIAHK
jgi:nucleotide-binding universal stress UspA family protein